MKRAERRQQTRRVTRQARRLYHWSNCPQKYANNLTTCSKRCCGNPRKWEKEKTRAEQIHWKKEWETST